MGLFPLNPLTLEAFWFGLFANHGVLVTAALVLFGAHIPYDRAILVAKWVSLGFLASTVCDSGMEPRHKPRGSIG